MNKNDDDFEIDNLDDEDNAEGLDKASDKASKNSILKEILYNSIYLLIVFIITLLLVKYVGQRTVVVGSSMQDTLQDGDNLIIDKISYRFNDPKRFDIIVFPAKFQIPTSEKSKEYYIKRIVGLPGEMVKIDYDGNIYINGEKLNESYGREVMLDPGFVWDTYTLGEDEYFVLGDNRNHSSDSRYFGAVKRDEIIGRAWIRVYPFNNMGAIDKGK